MALYGDNDPMVPVAFPDGSLRPMPSSLAAQLGVHPDQLAPQDSGVQRTMSDYDTATGMGTLPTFPPSTIVQPPTPPPDAAFPLPRQIPNGQSALPPKPAPAVPVKKLGQGGAPTPYGGEIAAPAPMGFDNVQQQRALTSSPTGDVDAISGAGTIAPTPANKPPPGAPTLTTQGLRDMGEAGVANEKVGALNAAANAGVATADVEAHAQTAFADAYEKRNAQIDGLLKQRADAADARQREIEGRMATYDTMVKKYADTKIDRSVDHPIIAAIGVALAGLGTAMKGGGENPALKILFDQIDRKVQGQMQDRDALGTKIGYQRAGIDLARTAATDKSAQYNLAIAGETEKAARQIEALGARSNSDIVRSRAQEGAALLRGKVADVVGQAVMSQQGKDERDRAYDEQIRHTKVEEKNQAQQTGIAYGHLGLARKGLDEQIREHDLQRQDKLDELALGYAKLGEKDKAAKAKEVAESGVFDPTTGNAVLTPEGQRIIDHADQLEIAARKKSPAEAQAMIAQAKNLRDQAEAVGGFTIGDKEARREVIKKVGASQNLIDTIGHIKSVMGTDPSSIDRNTWAELRTEFERAKVSYIEAHGAKASSREMQAMEEVFGDNPGEIFSSRVAGRGKVEASLAALEQGTINETSNELGAYGYKGKWSPRSKETAPQVLSGTTSQERAGEAPLGAVGERLSFTSNQDRSVKAENQGDVTPTGLSKQDTDTVTKLADRYENATDAQRSQILSTLQTYSSSDRPGLAQGVVTLINARNPGLYKAIVSSTPNSPRVAGDVEPRAAAQVLASTPVYSLRTAAMAGDDASKSELLRRQLAGDKQAQAALHDVIMSKGAR